MGILNYNRCKYYREYLISKLIKKKLIIVKPARFIGMSKVKADIWKKKKTGIPQYQANRSCSRRRKDKKTNAKGK